jgi:dTDP-4-dehydrorhamnose 3,5-epimerase
MKVCPTALPEVLLVEPQFFGDSRGGFFECYHATRYRQAGVSTSFVQDNLSYSSRSVLRGLHLQHPRGQAKLVQVLEGAVFDVAVDVRVGSPRFGMWVGEVLSAENHRQLFIPEGFAHGFCVLSDRAIFHYKCSDFYRPDSEVTVIWEDPDIGIEWPVESPILSDKDRRGVRLRSIVSARLPQVDPVS